MKLASILALLALTTGEMGQYCHPPTDARVISCDYDSRGRIDVFATTAIVEIGNTQFQVHHSGNQCWNLHMHIGDTVAVY
jgi:hypothetical protein